MPPDLGSVAMSFGAVLEIVAQRGPILVAIDDGQWVDPASAATLAFASRRLTDRSVHWLITRRRGESDRGFTPDLRVPTEHHVLQGMPPAELDAVLHATIGVRLPRPQLLQIAAIAAGNPFYAIELGRFLAGQSSADDATGQGLPPSLRGLTRARLDVLPPSVKRLALAAALASRPSLELLAKVEGVTVATVSRRVRVGITADVFREDDGDHVRFVHPLVAATAVDISSVADRRSAHRRLASFVTDVEERARHRALAGTGFDRSTARQLEVVARRARRRGAPVAAAELVGLAIERTPPIDVHARERRLLLAADLALRTGDTERATAVAEELAQASTAAVQCEARLILARVAWLSRTHDAVITSGEAALAAAGSPIDRARVHVVLAALSRNDRAWGLRHALAAETILDQLGEQAPPDLRLRAMVAVLDMETDLGLPLRTDVLVRALALADPDEGDRVADGPSYYLGTILLQRDQFASARTMLRRAADAAVARGDDGSLPALDDQLAQLELLVGDWPRARQHAEAQASLADALGQSIEALWGRETLALIDVREGVAGARDRADAVLVALREANDPMGIACALRTSAEAARTCGDLVSARDAFLEVDEIAVVTGIRSPSVFRHAADLVEVLVELGALEEADQRLRRLVADAHAGAWPWALSVARRSEAVVLAAYGRLDDALEHAEAAADSVRAIEMPFELGRALLVLGVVQRRRRAKAAAATALSDALAIFEGLGARPWVARTAQDQRRLGLRPAAPLALTDTERLVAELAAVGYSNPEIAARLSMSRKTVEFNLSKAYRKLRVRGRVQLAAALGRRSGELPGSSPELGA